MTFNSKSLLFYWGLFFFLTVTPGADASQNNGRLFLEGIRNYQSGDYKQALAAFLKVADSGVVNGKLFFNLGNTYLKKEELGKSILWYERAWKLIPGDPDLRFNLNYARSLVKDKTEHGNSPVVKVLFFVQDLIGKRQLQFMAIGFNLFFWILLALKYFIFGRFRKTTFIRVLMPVVLCITLLFSLNAFFQIYQEGSQKMAVIVSEEAQVRSGISDNATELFVLHQGTKVTVGQETGGYYRISFSEEKIGWLKKADAEII